MIAALDLLKVGFRRWKREKRKDAAIGEKKEGRGVASLNQKIDWMKQIIDNSGVSLGVIMQLFSDLGVENASDLSLVEKKDIESLPGFETHSSA